VTKIVNEPRQIEVDTVLVRSDKLLHSQIDQEVTMMSMETGRYYSLTKTGARIWSLLERPMSADAICRQLMTEYRVDRARCEAEVLSVLRRMAAEGVVAEAAE
jgi:hypothetical protein